MDGRRIAFRDLNGIRQRSGVPGPLKTYLSGMGLKRRLSPIPEEPDPERPNSSQPLANLDMGEDLVHNKAPDKTVAVFPGVDALMQQHQDFSRGSTPFLSKDHIPRIPKGIYYGLNNQYYFQEEPGRATTMLSQPLVASHHLATPRRFYPGDEPLFHRIGRRDILPPKTLGKYKAIAFNKIVQFLDLSPSLEVVVDEFQDVAQGKYVATTKQVPGEDTPGLYEIMRATMPAYFGEEMVEEREMEWPIGFFDICIPPSTKTDLTLE